MAPSSAQTRASIDLGTNTCLLLIAQCEQGSVTSVLEDHSTIVRLGEAVDLTRKFQDGAMKRTLACLEVYAERAQKAGIHAGEVRCSATSQARDATNAREFFEEVERRLGFRFKTLSGEQEARATFEGALLPGQDPKRSAVIDIGGGSTEIISHNGARSFDIGSVRFNERYLKSDPVSDGEFWACQEAIDGALGSQAGRLASQSWIAVAGTATTLAQWHLGLQDFDRSRIDAEGILSRGDVHRMVEELKWRSIAERAEIPGVGKGRADVLLAGAMILWRFMEIAGVRECRVSTRGLRYGTLMMDWEALGKG